MLFSKKFIIFLIFLISNINCFSQKRELPIYQIIEDPDFLKLDTNYFQLLADPTNKLTIDQIKSAEYSNKFQFESSYDKNRLATTYWAKIKLKNNSKKDIKLLLFEFYSCFTDLYVIDSVGNQIHTKAGYLRPYSAIDTLGGTKERARMYFKIAKNQELTLYQRINVPFWRSRLIYFAPRFQSQKARLIGYFNEVKVEEGWKEYFFDGIIIGILLLAVFYNLFIYFSIKDRVYLYFGISLFFITLDRNSNRFIEAFFRENPIYFDFFSNFFFIIFLWFFVQTFRLALQSKKYYKKIDWFARILLITIFIFSIIRLFVLYFYPNKIENIDLIIDILIRINLLPIVYINYLLIKSNFQNSKLLLISILPLMLHWVFTLSTHIFNKILFPEAYINNSVYIENFCFTWLIITFSGALATRYNIYKEKLVEVAIEKEQLEKDQEKEKNKLIEQQKENLERQVAERTEKLNTTIENLKSTQNQLIQSEKLASLGELTAGIAHEIQNPLNFVNNFSEVSSELVVEMKEELAIDNKELAFEISDDLKQNLEKITFHGKRASSIVKAMLEHSKSSSGEKEPTDINALADEYLRLSYHGLRAKNKEFNSEFKMDFDQDLPKISIIPQDIGRVLLNLINNAFYAVKKVEKPMVIISTKIIDNLVYIAIKDNGVGIKEATKAKIFQPFFTTKPTGEGTGLGLSLAFDIVAKGHGGTIEVESEEGKGSNFIVKIPI